MKTVNYEDLLLAIPNFTMSYVGDCEGLGLTGMARYMVTVPLTDFNDYIKKLAAVEPLNLVKHDVALTENQSLLKTWCTDKTIIHALFNRNGHVEVDVFHMHSDEEFKYVIDILDIVYVTRKLFYHV
ncbi:hypothetical protein PG919_26715 [Klebsiella pneumoniae]|uniref:hypothetical protein n=1 Tax=Klebsiella pneumoniae TaxID=573 RepID=UPI002151761B|nr:hypothetical protein [Klebsiella pneumoniae]EEI4451942.1 hypothetical protein [Salmonella enterica]EGR8821047.1 hypothetical protein [Salmonella enterica]MDA5131677.1 hypothetical protein [Klebsiella pneumoniae]MDA5192008.1 hypothetical protein [Klebsiella pneumoniae]HCJ2819320.1 hypothetical protein [Klebsiella pneumoniae]